MTPVLSVQSIESYYGQFQALSGISIAVEEGQTVAIIGANGAGKSTLMKAIAGVHPPTKGAIQFRGKPISGSSAYALVQQGIAMVPEGRRIFPSLTVEDNLLVGAYSGRKGQWTLDKVYELFPILKERRKNGGTDLSGGQQQMVAVGRALMSNPELILMDEVSLGLAPIVVNEIYEVIRRIAALGTTILLVEQDVSRGLREASYVYCLLEGRISLEGKPSDLKKEEISRAYFGI
ncbi:MAG: ABC transporter ATP-binding protein [Pleurocapsa minor GSE-CHR-MK-17-07R]|jgi:branched-chain amino acid transport system ATP-binding protein|nr:ABC transporter ATP-binding protein [Pleurocapsa minor GSE-CHR-MK 17-07R]